MTILFKNNRLSKLLIAIAVLMITGIYSCNNPASKEEKKESVTTPMDSGMKMKTDTTKTDTSGKGGQPLPIKN